MENYADRSKWTLEDFDVERAKRGDLVCTRAGRLVSELEIRDDGIVGKIFEASFKEYWHLDGSFVNKGRSDYRDLFHPVPVKEVKKKRIEFDASRVGEEEVEVVCRDDKYKFVKLLSTTVNCSQPIAVEHTIPASKGYPEESTVSLFSENGMYNVDNRTEYPADLFLLVPDTEPALPSMQEVAEKLKNSYLGHAMIYLAKHANPLADKGPFYNRMTAKIVVECLAEFLNDGWEPDWTNAKLAKTKYCYTEKRGLYMECVTLENTGSVYLKSKKTAKLFRKILNSWEPGDAILKRALGVNA